MTDKLKKVIILFMIFSVSIICLIVPIFAAIEFGITEDDLPDLINIGESVKETMQQEKIVWHNGKTLNIVRDDEIDKTKLTQTEYLQVIKDFTKLKNECTCINDSTYISHFGHSGCSLDDKWEIEARRCTHRTQWEKLFEKFATKTTSYGYYSFCCKWEDLKDNLESWIENCNKYYSITEVMNFLNDEDFDLNGGTSTGYYLLQYNSSFFCAKHNQAIGRHHSYFCRDHKSPDIDMFTKITTTGNTFDTYRVASYTPLTNNESYDYMDQDHEENDTRTVKSNTKYFLDTTYKQSLTKTQNIYEIYNGFGTYNTNVFAYALSYSEKWSEDYQGANYKNERAQLAMWAVVGNPGYGEPRTDTEVDYNEDEFENVDEDDETTTDPDLIINSGLYMAAGAVDEYEDILVEDLVASDLTTHINGGASEVTAKHMVAVEGSNPRIKNNPEVKKLSGNTSNVSSGLDIGNSASEPTGTTIFYENDKYYYRIGPFEMNDYALAEAKSNVPVEEYSGSGLDYPKLIGGIISGTLSFGNDTNSNTKEVTIGTGAGEARIEYEDALGNETSKGEAYTGNYITKPDTDSYPYPYPKSIFYIVVAQDDCGVDATKLVDISFEYRQTRTDGNGWVIRSKYIQTVFKRVGENPNPDSVCGKYHCTGSGGEGCYNDEINYTSRATLGVSHPYYCSEYKNGTKYCYKGTKNCSTHCGGDCNTCSHDCNCEDECSHSCSSSSLDYCAHGYLDGKHNNYKYPWGATANTTCKHETKCNAHNHEDCYDTHWGVDSQGAIAGQPFLAVRDAFVEVVKMKVTTPGINIRLTTNVTIDKYIYNVEHTKTGNASSKESYIDYDDKYDSDNFSETTEREDKTDEDKSTDFLKVERGDEITYKIVLKNSSNIDVDVQVKDVLPDYCDFVSVDVGLAKDDTNAEAGRQFFITDWLTVPKKSGTTPGTKTITVKIIATASGERDTWNEIITNENEATLVSSNAGRNLSGSSVTKDDDHINYVRLSDSTNGMDCGAVVNLAQLDGSNVAKVLDSSDYYRVKSYSIVLDKYISRVEHVTTGEVTYERFLGSLDIEKNGWVKTDSAYVDRDIYNDNETIGGQKYEYPIYVEYGDRVTYDIDIQNTWHTNDKEINNKGDMDKTINTSPYYAPNYVKVNISDKLPECYQKGSLKVEYIVHDTGTGNVEDEKIDSHGTSLRYTITEHDSENKASRISTTAGDVLVNLYDNTLTVNNLYINPCSEATLRISFIVDTSKIDQKYENKANLIEIEGGAAGNYLDYSIKNINDWYVYNTTNKYKEDGTKAPLRVDSADYFILNDYNVDIETYITDYREEMLHQNAQTEEAYKTYEIESDNFDVEGLETWEGNSSDKSKTRRRVNGSVSGMNDAKKAGNPVQVEKNETLQYTIRLYNNSKGKTLTEALDLSSNARYYYKPATTVRTSSIKVTLDDGLALYTGDKNSIKVKATIYPSIKDADNKENGNSVNVDIGVDWHYNEFYFNIPNKYNVSKSGDALDKDYTLLQPGGVIEYTMDVQVVKSNMYLESLENNAGIYILTDVNNEMETGDETSGSSHNEDNHTRVVTKRNLMNYPNIYTYSFLDDDINIFTYPSSSDYVKLKDLIIAGRVWLDRNKDGYMGNISGSIKQGDSREIVYADDSSEKVMEGIIVKLYKADASDPIAITRTNSQGLYTFAKDENMAFKDGLNQRVKKAEGNSYIDYYVEFEYDGVTYKATEVYGGNNELDNNWGQGNLAQNWFQLENKEKYYNNDYVTTPVASEVYLKYDTILTPSQYFLQRIYTNENYKYDSNAYEFKDVREKFNKNYETVTYNYAYATDGEGKASTSNGGADLEFTKDGHTSYLNINHERVMKSRSFIKRNSDESLSNTDTLSLYNNSYTNFYSGDGRNALPETEYLKYINLGLEEREEIDISLTKDVYEVKTTVNGEEMTYSYDQNEGVNGQMETNEYLQNYEVGKPYGLTLYESDFKYRAEQYKNQAVKDYKGEESELNIEVTYRIRIDSTKFENDEPFMTDTDRELETTVHEIVDLYDENFVKYNDNPHEYIRLREKDEDNIFKDDDKEIKIAEAWCYDNGGNKVELTLSNSSKYLNKTEHATKDNDFTSSNNTGYNTLYITGMDTPHTKIPEGGYLDVFVKYVVDKEEKVDTKAETIDGNAATVHTLKGELKIGNDDLINKETENIAQINSYSIWYEDGGKPTSIVDTDSNAGNVGENNEGTKVSPDDTTFYEDTVYKTEINITSLNSPNEPENVGEGGGTLSSTNPIIPIRTITGKVWDDARTSETDKTETGKITKEDGTQETSTLTYTNYSGDGLYDTSLEKKSEAMANENVEKNYKDSSVTEKKDIDVRSAKVEYVEIVAMRSDSDTDGDGKKDLIYYEEKLDKDSVTWEPVQEDRTEDDGTYELAGFIPGYYIVRYTYGDSVNEDSEPYDVSEEQKDMIIFNGQDYKSTKYTGTSDVAITDEEKNDVSIREDRIVKEMELKEKSDAKDDEIKRLETIAYSETMVNQRAEILKGLANGTVTDDDSNSVEELKSLTDNTYMYADTVQFYVKPEKLETNTNPDKLDIKEEYNSYISNGIAYAKQKHLEFTDTFVKERTFNIKNLDFGIEYRPESQITLNKEVSSISLITSDGEELVKLALRTINFGKGENQEHEIIEEESIGLEYTQFISNDYKTINPYALTSEDYQGFIFINVDDDILQGSTIKIDYRFVAENNSEIDFVTTYLDTLRYRENITDTTIYDAYKNVFSYTNLNETVGAQNELFVRDTANNFVGITTGSIKSLDDEDKFVYSAAGTARNLLYAEYYDKDTHGSTYRKKELKTYDITEDADGNQKKSDTAQIQDKDVYYGRYLSKFYYLGELGTEDVIASLKFDKVLDYVDTDLVFRENPAEKEKNKLWTTSTDNELKGIFVHEKSFTEQAITVSGLLDMAEELIDKQLVNSKGISYVTYQENADNTIRPVTSNLVISVDDRVTDLHDNNINESLSRYLLPYWEETGTGGMMISNAPDSRGNIILPVSKVISAEADTDDLQYENIAEVIQFTSQTGRRTNYATTIGNAAVSYGEFKEAEKETDTTATEVITLTPPTGLDRLNRVVRDTVETAGMGIGITVVAIALVIGGLVIVRFTIKKIKKRPIK